MGGFTAHVSAPPSVGAASSREARGFNLSTTRSIQAKQMIHTDNSTDTDKIPSLLGFSQHQE
jgi:hypothetical protein